MSVGATRGLLGRVQKLERSRSVGADMLASVTTVFTDAIAQGRMCDTDGPVVMKCASSGSAKVHRAAVPQEGACRTDKSAYRFSSRQR